MRRHRRERGGIVDLQRTGHRQLRKIRVREHELAVGDMTAVQVHKRAAARTDPIGHALAVHLAVFHEDVVTDAVKKVRIDGHALVGPTHGPAREFGGDEAMLGEFAGGCLGQRLIPGAISRKARHVLRRECRHARLRAGKRGGQQQ